MKSKRVSGCLCGLLFWSIGEVTVHGQQPPAFTLQPADQSVSVGAAVTFRSACAGTPPLHFLWQLAGAPLPGATTNSLSLTNVQLVDAGEYRIVVSNAWGTATSKAILLDVDPTFQKITAGPVATDGGDSTGTAWGDFDLDGDLDLFVSNFGTRYNFLYRNHGDQTFSRAESGIVATDDVNAEGSVWGDYDNDGDLDLFVAVGLGGNDLLYRNDGNASFSRMTNALPARSGGSSRGAAWADYDRDGWLDLFVANEQGQNNFLFRNDAAGGFTRVLAGDPVTERANSYSGTWADYDNDGWLDLFVANNGRRNSLYRNGGDGTFTHVSTGAVATNSANSASGAWGDYDNDGFLDLFVANLGQKNFLFHNNGDGSFTRITNGAVGAETSSSWGGAWGDYDNDGYLDLFVANGQPNGTPVKDFLFRNQGDGTFRKLTRGSVANDSGAGDGCAWGDYNHDGFLDLFVANLNGQNNFLYANGGNSNHWLMIECRGRASNYSAIGARLELTVAGEGRTIRQIREVSGGSGYASQNSLVAHFGLGQAARVQSLRIRWPSGIVQDLEDLAVNRRLIVSEPAQLLDAQFEAGIFRARYRSAGPGRVLEVSDDLVQWQSATSVRNDAAGWFEDELTTPVKARFYRIREP